MGSQADGIIYYCKLPLQFARQGGRVARLLLARGFADFFQADFDEAKMRREGYGKPYYEENERFQFNISHCRSAAAAAVSYLPVGIDVESMRRVNRGVVEKCCDSSELSYIFDGMEAGPAGRDCLSEAETMRFLNLWTLKESYVKMTGEGLSLPFHTVNFNVSGLASLKERHEREVSGNGRWNRYFLYPAGDVVMALAAQGGETTGQARFAWKEAKFDDIWKDPGGHGA